MSQEEGQLAEKIVKPDEAPPMTLTPLEFERLEKARLQSELRQKDSLVLRLKLSSLKDKRKILELTSRCYDLDEKLLSEELATLDSQAVLEKKAHEGTLQEIRARLGITGRFGYDPDTLEVVKG